MSRNRNLAGRILKAFCQLLVTEAALILFMLLSKY